MYLASSAGSGSLISQLLLSLVTVGIGIAVVGLITAFLFRRRLRSVVSNKVERDCPLRVALAVSWNQFMILLGCLPLPDRRCLNIYLSYRSYYRLWVDDEDADSFPKVSKLLRAGFLDFWKVLRTESVRNGDLDKTIYRFVDIPMQGFVFWAIPLGVAAGIVTAGLAMLMDQYLALAVVSGTLGFLLGWFSYVGIHLRRHVNSMAQGLTAIAPLGRGQGSDSGRNGVLESDGGPVGTPASFTQGSKVWTIPNAISFARLSVGSILISAFVSAQASMALVVTLLACWISDWLDGWAARRFDQRSELGRILDSLADRAVLLSFALANLAVGGPAPTWLAAAIVIRETLVIVVGILLTGFGSHFDVVWQGKAGFALLVPGLIVISLSSAFAVGPASDLFFTSIGAAVAIGGLVFHFAALIRYVRELLPLLRISSGPSLN